MMRKVVAYELLSVDGVAENPNAFVFDFDEVMYAHLADVISRQDAVLLGRAQHDEWASYWPTSDDQPFADFINGVPKYVATSSPLAASWNNVSAIEGSVPDFVQTLKSQDGGDIGVHGSMRLTESLLVAGLVDVLHVVIAPTLLGTGEHLVKSPDAFHRLRLVSCETAPAGALLVRYDVDNTGEQRSEQPS